MKILVLLSAGRDPPSGAARPVPAELQAIALARQLPDADIIGLHAGVPDAAVCDALGHGLAAITLLRIDPADDPLPSLAAEAGRCKPDLILAGRRGRGGTDSGMLPYRLAHATGLPIAADAMAIERIGGDLAVTQSLPRGARRLVRLALPAVVTVHDAAPPAQAFIYQERRRGRLNEFEGIPAADAAPAFEIRPYRQHPRLIGAAAQSRAATQAMVAPSPEAAAAAVLAFLGLRLVRPGGAAPWTPAKD